MDYNKETDKYLVDNKVLYTSKQKNKFDEICLAYNLVSVTDDQYKCTECDITITSKPKELIIIVRPDNSENLLEDSFDKDFYEFIEAFACMYFQKMKMLVSFDEVAIFSLKGLIQFLDLLELYKATKNVSGSVLKKEIKDYRKRLTRY